MELPRIKHSEAFEPMRRLIRGYGLNGTKLAKVLNVSEQTARSRIREPERLTLGDLERLNRMGGIPLDEIRAAIR